MADVPRQVLSCLRRGEDGQKREEALPVPERHDHPLPRKGAQRYHGGIQDRCRTKRQQRTCGEVRAEALDVERRHHVSDEEDATEDCDEHAGPAQPALHAPCSRRTAISCLPIAEGRMRLRMSSRRGSGDGKCDCQRMMAVASASAFPAGTSATSCMSVSTSSRIAAESRVISGRPAAMTWNTLLGMTL